MGIITRNVVVVVVVLFISMNILASTSDAQSGCNLYEGKWVFDKSYPLSDSLKCSFLRKEFSCLRNGRPDRQYLKYRWQPNGCDLPRFDGKDFLTRMKGKKIMFIGDSVSDNQWQSLLCLLSATVGGSNFTTTTTKTISTATFQEYNVSISMFLSHYLVDIQNQKIGRVLNLDSIRDGLIWKEFDVLIFNTWLWWYRNGPKQPWDYIENDGKIMKDMDRMAAFRKGLMTWAKWVQTDINPSKTRVFIQGVSPMHYHGNEWNEPAATDCSRETTPFNGTVYPAGEPLASKVLKQVLRENTSATKPVHLLDITYLSQLRKDGHPSKYNGFGMDCTHWCVAGAIDTWNLILNAKLLQM